MREILLPHQTWTRNEPPRKEKLEPNLRGRSERFLAESNVLSRMIAHGTKRCIMKRFEGS